MPGEMCLVIQDMDRLRALVDTVMSQWVPQNAENFLLPLKLLNFQGQFYSMVLVNQKENVLSVLTIAILLSSHHHCHNNGRHSRQGQKNFLFSKLLKPPIQWILPGGKAAGT